ncbi:non-hydrolyzing UDP-N-acetylglucosamine 2-epimerase [Vibrio atypicus]|uniref:non-hydrolyzing UDP-N-acetylglucosamine 2-epimerase n=1 Tax=Vibrio atypicus TaxID=558271 RepID=UPI00135A82AE|nr:UDP-N-acetylglucosamine 2-epimerase (non-hydrolyzing) [Vibrio atypicus]
MKIVTVVGARPQFIKAGTVSRELLNYPNVEEVIVHTGQHYDQNMSDIFFEEMKIPKPTYSLGIGGKSHGAMTGQMIESIEKVLVDEKPDWVLVYGDTNSTLAASLAASKLHIKVAHIEAGLRSFNMKMPEEINRILTDRVSSLLFCPTRAAIDNLESEGLSFWDGEAFLSGDVMQDGALFYKSLAIKPKNLGIEGPFILSTIHRAENTDDQSRLRSIFTALEKLALDTQVVLPLHPRTRNIIANWGINLSKNIKIIDPVGYLNMVWLIDHCKLVMTDSGGLQKEAFFFAKPCITLRDETEWVELVENKFNVLVGASSEKILTCYHNFHFSSDFKMNLYGGGHAAKNIINTLVTYEN